MTTFGTIITAMVTPFKTDGSVHYDEAVRIAEHLIETGTDTLLICGTTGEAPTLTHDEEFKLFTTLVKTVGNKAKIIAGTGSNCTQTAINSSKKAAEIGVDGLLQVTPYYNKPSQEGIRRHFEAIAKATALPIMLYNIPGRTGANMTPETIAHLAQMDTITSLKEAAGSVSQFKAIKQIVPETFILYSGDDGLTLPFLQNGASGVVSVASHIVGLRIQAMIQAYFQNDTDTATHYHNQLNDLFEVLFITSNPSPVKYALSLLGFQTGIPRLPIVEPLPAEKEKIKTVLTQLELI